MERKNVFFFIIILKYSCGCPFCGPPGLCRLGKK